MRTAASSYESTSTRSPTGVPLRDHAWHFCAATFDAATGDVVLYHEPQIVYALDPIIEPVKTNLKVAISHAPVPVGLGVLCRRPDAPTIRWPRPRMPPGRRFHRQVQRQDR